ncbi:hypothetical protein [Kurthia sibirica]|uniref:Uncharacterized protein n=1 Tax=Kurthia sibirica TaxID=202750 RepID=A0A2U3AGH3_9BACL|nr:hypothetical protein [Kurthia sibirica]PWI23551.1 hypothetical protein DEX24_16065 [Kurthia sibirica]GEK35405.1 hypothetical protein KSI01_29380 [Kurthia sibirica]
MFNSMLNAIVGSNIDSIASLPDKDEKTTKFFNSFTLSQTDIWLYSVSFGGLLVLTIVILAVMRFNKNKTTSKTHK